MTDFFTQTHVEDIYEKIRQHVLADEIEAAVELLKKAGRYADLILLSFLADDLADDLANALSHALIPSHVSTGSSGTFTHKYLELAHNLADLLANEVDFSQNRTLVLAYSLGLAIDLTLMQVSGPFRSEKEIEEIIAKTQRFTRFLVAALESARKTSAQGNEPDEAISKIILINHPTLTIHVLKGDVVPYLEAMVALQQVITEMRGETFIEPIIRELSHNSPLTATFTGNIVEAVLAIRGFVVPWRRAYAKQKANLEIQAGNLAIAETQAKIHETNLRIAQTGGETIAYERALVELEQMRLQNERQKIENARLHLEFEKERIALAKSVINEFAPGLSEDERLMWINRLVKPLNLLTNSDLEIQ